MSNAVLTTTPLTGAERNWTLDLDAELASGAPAITDHQVQALVHLLTRMPTVKDAAAERHCEGRFVHCHIAVEARDFASAIDRAAVYLRSCAIAAGLGSVVLVSVGHAR